MNVKKKAINTINRNTLFASIILLSMGCTNLKDFNGIWEGDITEDSSVRSGFSAHTRMQVDIQYADSRRLEATMTTCVSDEEQETCTPGDFDETPLEHLEKAQNDALNTLTFGGEPYAVFLMTAQPTDPDKKEMIVIVSLHGKDRIELRLLRGNERYGVFRLSRQKDN